MLGTIRFPVALPGLLGLARDFSILVAVVLAFVVAPARSRADETCQSPYLAKIVGQEDFLYVWTVGIEGVGDGFDKLVTIGVNPARTDYGKIVHVLPVGSRNEAHHAGFTDDRRHLWAGGLDSSRIFVFDVGSDPAKPQLVRTIDDFPAKTGWVGPHTFYPIPGRMLITGLSNAADLGGRTGYAEFNNDGTLVRTVPMPENANYGYDLRINAHLNRMLSSSFSGHRNYMRKLPELLGDAEAMKQFGNTMVVWDFHARRPIQVLEVPGAPLEIRWALAPDAEYAFTTTALTSKIWGVFRKADGRFEAVEVGTIGDPAKTPLPVDISLSRDDRTLFVDTFMDGMVRVYDVSNPRRAKQIYEKKIGGQVNMVSQSWDGKRLYFTSSLLANWDGTGDPKDEQFVKAFDWDGKRLSPTFALDFRALGLGRPHHMHFGQLGFWGSLDPQQAAADVTAAN
jgi:methanethiol oxidase